MNILEVVDFTLRDVRHDEGFRTADLKKLAGQLAAPMEKRGFDVSELNGSSTDLWGFEVAMDDGNDHISVSFSPNDRGTATDWSVSFFVDADGCSRETPARYCAEMKRIQWAVHAILVEDFAAEDIVWLPGDERVPKRVRQCAP